MENIETLLAALAQTQGFDDDELAVSSGLDAATRNSENFPEIQEGSGASQLNSRDSQPALTADVHLHPQAQSVASSAGVSGTGAGGRKRRGRPPKGQMAVNSPPLKRTKVEEEEEDVCFVCFDGGSLVLCDRKGCPKAYHPACIKRDEAFFMSKAKWNCGWHICSVCRKASHYICYTCPYSLCKGCTKDSDYLTVRGNKGFCSTCMKTIMLIENKDHANTESIQVDFDDKTSWEYLFKVYWVCLKEKLSLTLNELKHAKNPWKPEDAVILKRQFGRVRRTAEVSVTCGSQGHLELNRKTSSTDNCVEKLNMNAGGRAVDGLKMEFQSGCGDTELNLDKSDGIGKQITENNTKDAEKSCICKNAISKESSEQKNHKDGEWASKELLEFIGHIKNGDVSAMPQFDVQTLLLEYIKKNGLRDPHQKSQIICDSRLRNLFRKPRVGHIEMLKLLEYHFLLKDDTTKNSLIPAGFVCSGPSDNEADDITYDSSMPANSRKRRARRKTDNTAPKANPNENAAIDVHNINLIYLHRSLLEKLVLNQENFDRLVMDSIVRIRLPSTDQKQDAYRLVPVVGTSKVSEPYKIGDSTINVMLEVLNLDKKELVSIDAISQEFTEDECKRLRQSIRCNLVKRFTVGEIEKKASELQAIKVNDWLEAEIRRLNYLRDRASENGSKRELRKYVVKLQLLSSPEERQRRISQAPDVHVDQRKDSENDSEDDGRSGHSSKRDEHVAGSHQTQRRNACASPKRKGKRELSNLQQNRKISSASGSRKSEINSKQSTSTSQLMQESGGGAFSAAKSDHIEKERLWHYRDPNGKIQGPFSMILLRKWSMTGFFPPDMRIWTNHEQYDSLLLVDALNGQFHAASDPSWKPSSKSEEIEPAAGFRLSEGINQGGDEVLTASCSPLPKNNGSVAAEESHSSWPKCWDLLKVSGSGSDQPCAAARPDQTRVSDGLEQGCREDNKASFGGHELPKQPPLGIDLSASNIEIVSAAAATAVSAPSPAENNQPAQKTRILELLSPTPRSNINEEVMETKTLDMPATSSGSCWTMASNLVLGGMQMPAEGEEWCGYSPTTAFASAKPPEMDAHAQNIPNWLATLHEPIEFDAFGEEAVSDLLAEVDAMESQGASLPSPTSAIKFERDLLEDCKDDCFSSIEEFSSAHGPLGSDALSSTGGMQHHLHHHQGKPSSSSSHIDAFDFFSKSSVHSSSFSSEAETRAPGPVYPNNTINEMVGGQVSGPPDTVDLAGCGTVQGNINLVTVQGNVNLVLGGPAAPGMANLGWGINPGAAWVNPSHSRSGGLPWDNQRKFSSPREWGYQVNEAGFGRGRPPWSRQQYGGGGGYSRPLPKGQRVCKFYESGHCKKGALCDYLHP